jgi:hypothetical protein
MPWLKSKLRKKADGEVPFSTIQQQVSEGSPEGSIADISDLVEGLQEFQDPGTVLALKNTLSAVNEQLQSGIIPVQILETLREGYSEDPELAKTQSFDVYADQYLKSLKAIIADAIKTLDEGAIPNILSAIF